MNFTTTLNNAPRNEERTRSFRTRSTELEQDPISLEQGVDFQRMEIGSNGKYVARTTMTYLVWGLL